MDRQFDPPFLTQFNRTLPADSPGRTTTDDFVFFVYDALKFPYEKYDVCIETYGTGWRKLGPLRPRVKLPCVQFVNDTSIMLVPRSDPTMPRYMGTVQRGHTYTVSSHVIVNGVNVLT
jgi:hypothetical protein